MSGSARTPWSAGDAPTDRLEATVSGRVQGVGFRWWARGVAEEHGLTGYAKNLYSGEVEIVAEGGREAVEAMLAALTSGNTAGHVDRVEHEYLPATGEYRDFGTY